MITFKTNWKIKEMLYEQSTGQSRGDTRAIGVSRFASPNAESIGAAVGQRWIGAADEVTDWNHIMLEATLYATSTVPATPAPISTRSTAMVQAAIFDAVNGIDPHYTPIFV